MVFSLYLLPKHLMQKRMQQHKPFLEENPLILLLYLRDLYFKMVPIISKALIKVHLIIQVQQIWLNLYLQHFLIFPKYLSFN